MSQLHLPLSSVYDGWDGYHTSILHTVEPLTPTQLAFRPAPGLRSVGEIASHIALGRIEWFARMPAPGSKELASQFQAKHAASLGDYQVIAADHEAITWWLNASWQMIDQALHQWTTADLARTFHHEYWGKVYAVSFQWTIWRILTHDIHHGGELALLLGMQQIEVPELGDLFGHLTMPPLA